MISLKDDPTLAHLPAPVSLTPEQMRQVAAGTGVMLGALYSHIIIAGGYPPVSYLSVSSAAPPA